MSTRALGGSIDMRSCRNAKERKGRSRTSPSRVSLLVLPARQVPRPREVKVGDDRFLPPSYSLRPQFRVICTIFTLLRSTSRRKSSYTFQNALRTRRYVSTQSASLHYLIESQLGLIPSTTRSPRRRPLRRTRKTRLSRRSRLPVSLLGLRIHRP